MRPHIERLDTMAMPWNQKGPGSFSKLLSTDPDNGARTALQRVVPSQGAKAPSVPHYHHSNEEILIVKGRLSFDSKVWLGPNSYCYHPAQTVHGFKSSVPEETWFLSRHSQTMDTLQVPDPEKREYYSVADQPPDRGLAVIPDPAAETWDEVEQDGNPSFKSLLLSVNPKTGEGSRLVRFLPGSSHRDATAADGYEEIFVLEGALEATDGATFGEGGYSFRPPGEDRLVFDSPEGALVYVNFGPG